MTQGRISLSRRTALRAGLRSLSVPVDASASDELPSEIRLFVSGVNDTAKGPFLFDEEAARRVMAAASSWDVDIMIDLEHLSLDEDAPNYDPDARGWGRLELRADGSLWLVGVRWTPDGAQRLRERRQRYISPAFAIDTNDPPRPTEILNIALVAMPATHSTPALVAARRRGESMNPKQLAKLLKLRREGKSESEILAALAIDIKSLQAVVKAMGGDPSGDLGTLMATVAAYAQELADMASGKPAEAPAAEVAEEMAAPPAEEEKPAQMSRELAQLRNERLAREKADADELQRLRAEKLSREAEERRGLVARLVVLGRETPATAWVNSDGRTPRGSLASMPLSELRERVEAFGGAPFAGAAPVAPPSGSVTSATSGPEISEYEAKRVALAAKRAGVDADAAIERYIDIKTRQLNAAQRLNRDVNRFGRKLEQGHVIASVTGKIGAAEIRTLTNAVRPHETFGTTSQRAIEEFRLDLMVNQAAMPDDWTQEFGLTVPGGTTKDTFPLDFSAVKYHERLAQNAKAETPQAREISLTKREFRVAKQGNLRKIQEGDFAYIRTWQQGPAQMARAKVALRASLVKTILEAGASTKWGVTADQPNGVENVNYFATTHKVHPFNPSMTIASTGAATWSNYQASATPLSTPNLFAELDSMLYVPHFDGELLGTEGDAILIPTSLVGIARRMFDTQPFRSDGETSSVQLGNEFFGHPMKRVHANQLTGSGATANYYILATGTIAMGFYPWVVAEDSEDEILIWDESSDFYKATGDIRVEEKTYINAALAWPHGIRLVLGA